MTDPTEYTFKKPKDITLPSGYSMKNYLYGIRKCGRGTDDNIGYEIMRRDDDPAKGLIWETVLNPAWQKPLDDMWEVARFEAIAAIIEDQAPKVKLGQKRIYLCDRCGSADVAVEMYCEWDLENQQWVIEADTNRENAFCQACQDITGVHEAPYNPPTDYSKEALF